MKMKWLKGIAGDVVLLALCWLMFRGAKKPKTGPRAAVMKRWMEVVKPREESDERRH